MKDGVVIIGAGIVGCATAYFLAREGVSVTVVDPSGIAAGASGRNNGLVEHPYDDAAVALFDETVDLMQEVLGEAMPAAPVGTLVLAEDEASAHGVLEYYQQFPELAPMLLGPEEVREAEPLLAPDLWGCMLDTGYPINPHEATSAFADLAHEAGAEFVDRRFEGARHADVVVAAGAATPAVLAGLMPADIVPPGIVTPLWGVIVLVQLPQRPTHPLIEATIAIGMSTGDLGDEAPFTLLDAPSYLAVGSTLLEGAQPRGEDWAPRLLKDGTRFVPSIEKARVDSILVCARPRSFDNRPILGRVPGQDRLWIATGHGGRGMSLGAASGRLLADAIIARDDREIPDELSSRRLCG